jgi:hypothetical protein
MTADIIITRYYTFDGFVSTQLFTLCVPYYLDIG